MFFVPLFPSVTEASVTDAKNGPSSSTMVAWPEMSASTALTGALRFSAIVSLPSLIVSPLTVTVTVLASASVDVHVSVVSGTAM